MSWEARANTLLQAGYQPTRSSGTPRLTALSVIVPSIA